MAPRKPKPKPKRAGDGETPGEVRPKLAVWKFASCDGCQLTLLDCEDALLEIAAKVEIANFPEASRAIVRGPYDVSLVEGSITTSHDAERIHTIRRASKVLVAIGACATAGGIQALRNFSDVGGWMTLVYGRPDAIPTLRASTPISDHVKVDFELHGCPISKEQLIRVLGAILRGNVPRLPHHSVCLDCKRNGTICVTVAEGQPCLGPVTRCGCGALCPSHGRGCYGCFGPLAEANFGGMGRLLEVKGVDAAGRGRLFRGIYGAAEAFRVESESHGRNRS